MNKNSKKMIKCIFIGNLSVGKTSIILRYTKNEFSGGYIPTIGADFTTIPLKIKDFEGIKEEVFKKSVLKDLNLSYDEFTSLNSKPNNEDLIYIWDLAGQPLFQKIRSYYMSHVVFTVIVVDLSKIVSFNIDQWIKDLDSYSFVNNFILVGNKSDIIDFENDIDLKERINLLEEKYNKKMLITSAKTGNGVRELLCKIKIEVMQNVYL
ncbi:MAG: Rab family GTPase [Promethearchaeota archaeon]